MKKTINFLLALCFLAIPLCSAEDAPNLQKIYPVNSDVYKAISYLSLCQGLSLPSTTGPWSADELIKMLSRIDPSRLGGGASDTYTFALAALDENQKAVKFSLKTTMEGYCHTNTTDFTKESSWIRGFDERNPIFDLILETWPSLHFYGYSSLSAGNTMYNGWNSTEGATSTLWGASALTTNIPMVPPAVMSDLNFNFPYRAVGSIGGDGWSAEVGREKYSWGPGESGNFVLGDHLLYHNMGRLTAYGKDFKYTFATSFFPYPGNFYPIMIKESGAYSRPQEDLGQDKTVSGLDMFIGHRVEWRIFGNKVGFALTEAIMYQSADNTLDLSVLSPTAIFHNYFIRGNANSIISLEADWTPLRYLNLYSQIVVDEFALPGEAMPGIDPKALPDAYGFMAGAKGSLPFGKGMLFGSVEWAKTDPYLYLRDNGNRNQVFTQYGINWVVALREFSNQGGINYTEEFIGYQYGCDAIVLNGNFGYKEFGRWSLEGNVFFMIHGTHDQWTTTGDQNEGAQDTETTPTTTHSTENNADIHEEERDCASYTLVLGARGGYKILKRLELFGQVDYIHITNPGNISTNTPIWDVQLTAGVTYSL
ncbi:MAG: hypothetical protein NT061_12940 [Spirochaetes bacterium]|nr:hypothetical protein [Spirochaetota bacterium]